MINTLLKYMSMSVFFMALQNELISLIKLSVNTYIV